MSRRQRNIVEASDLDDNIRKVLDVLADQANDDGENAFPSVPLIAWKVDLSERTVQRTLRIILALKYAEQVSPGGGRESAKYRLHVERAPQKVPYSVATCPACSTGHPCGRTHYREMTDREKSELIQRRKALRRKIATIEEEDADEVPATDAEMESLGQIAAIVEEGAGQNVTGDSLSPLPRQPVTAEVTPCHRSGDTHVSPDPPFISGLSVSSPAAGEPVDRDGYIRRCHGTLNKARDLNPELQAASLIHGGNDAAGWNAAAEWFADGIPLDVATPVIVRLVGAFKPRPSSPRIGGLAYFNAAVRDEWEQRRAAADAAAVQLPDAAPSPGTTAIPPRPHRQTPEEAAHQLRLDTDRRRFVEWVQRMYALWQAADAATVQRATASAHAVEAERSRWPSWQNMGERNRQWTLAMEVFMWMGLRNGDKLPAVRVETHGYVDVGGPLPPARADEDFPPGNERTA